MSTAPPDTIASRYRVLRDSAAAAWASSTSSEHVNTGDHLALKVLLGRAGAEADVVERFKREARAPARYQERPRRQSDRRRRRSGAREARRSW